MNSYRNFAQVYDLLMTDYPYEEVYQWILKKVEEQQINPDSILEMACGTGSLTSHLLSLGKVYAFDLSSDMLAMAQNKLSAHGALRLFQMDMRTFQMNQVYDLVLCLCDSLNYLPSLEAMDEVFQRVSQALKPGGLWLFDFNTEYNFKTNFKDYNFIFDLDEVYCVWDNFYDEENRENHYQLDIFQPVGDAYKRSCEHHIEYAYTMEEIQNLIDKHGFKCLSINDGYTNHKANNTSLRTTWAVTKEK